MSGIVDSIREKVGEAKIAAKESYEIGKAKVSSAGETGKLKADVAADKAAHNAEHAANAESQAIHSGTGHPTLLEKASAKWDATKDAAKEKLGEAKISAKENYEISKAKTEAAGEKGKLQSDVARDKLAHTIHSKD